MKGGFVVPQYLGSKATFTLGQFGGHVGRALRTGDVLRLSAPEVMQRFMQSDEAPEECAPAPAALISKYGKRWNVAVTPGPHAAPDFFTRRRHSARSTTPSGRCTTTPAAPACGSSARSRKWARTDGGEAGLHPSNVHDNAYAIGAVDFTGDMPVILGPDGPSLGGFVCPAHRGVLGSVEARAASARRPHPVLLHFGRGRGGAPTGPRKKCISGLERRTGY